MIQVSRLRGRLTNEFDSVGNAIKSSRRVWAFEFPTWTKDDQKKQRRLARYLDQKIEDLRQDTKLR